MNVYEELAERQLRRVDMFWTRFESTGEERWAAAAVAADRVYLRLRAVSA